MNSSNNPNEVGNAVARKVKTVSLETIKKNAARDGAQFAWIPSGDTCPFCMMLAANGWQRASKKTIKSGHKEHVHNNCDCTYAVRFDDDTEVEGYDPEYYKKLYDEADGNNWKQKVNAMRRDQYAANEGRINAQKRAAYAKKHGNKPEERVLTERLAIAYNNNPDFIPLHTIITEPYAIAGSGTNKPIRDIARLVAVYHRDEGEWRKMVGKIISDKYQFDIHWYENDDKIVLEPKIKYFKEIR